MSPSPSEILARKGVVLPCIGSSWLELDGCGGFQWVQRLSHVVVAVVLVPYAHAGHLVWPLRPLDPALLVPSLHLMTWLILSVEDVLKTFSTPWHMDL